jgi:hypothetical protein
VFVVLDLITSGNGLVKRPISQYLIDILPRIELQTFNLNKSKFDLNQEIESMLMMLSQELVRKKTVTTLV